jgi:hypothetical protein
MNRLAILIAASLVVATASAGEPVTLTWYQQQQLAGEVRLAVREELQRRQMMESTRKERIRQAQAAYRATGIRVQDRTLFNDYYYLKHPEQIRPHTPATQSVVNQHAPPTATNKQ